MKQTAINKRTEEKIRQAFLHLLNEHYFTQITINMLVKEAGVSRGTFYVHYEDIYALRKQTQAVILQQLGTKTRDGLIAMVDDYQHGNHDIPSLAVHLEPGLVNAFNLRKSIHGLATNAGYADFRKSLHDKFHTMLFRRNLFHADIVESMSAVPDDYVEELIVTSMLSMIAYWLNKDNPETPAEFAVILLQTLVIAPIHL
ncbi:TetR/AcrR family transcriptional regulator [Periweissella cryptocerci]|uniref:TetR/AcrR family transcriptional regulator n=1 Tax=Periweissella cryptocerci TaxID=2506420 RepID=A0A4P6YRC1_9LACO|nr:TetR/AcrR family transcriptional regulator [Periweissella cryptocerci]QBO35142.1 TetR/AcrR family transcriptional regulator [Periweissella cryptocerci]